MSKSEHIQVAIPSGWWQLMQRGMMGGNGRYCLPNRKIKPLDFDTNIDTIINMASVASILVEMRRNPKGIRFNDLCKVCDHYFGEPRQSGSSHRVYKTPWIGDPRVNIQNQKGKAKPYQVRQVVKAIDRLEANDGN